MLLKITRFANISLMGLGTGVSFSHLLQWKRKAEKKRLPVAPTAARLSSMAHRLSLLQNLAHRWHLGKDQPGHP
jgi:hypothetical protein